MSNPVLPPGHPDGAAAPGGIVACLCAEWCTTCEAYRAPFAEVARRHPDHRFVWIDIEAHSDALGDEALDIDNFPTVMLVAPGGRVVLFNGTVLPHAQTLDRLVQAARQGGLAPVSAGATMVAAVVDLARSGASAGEGAVAVPAA